MKIKSYTGTVHTCRHGRGRTDCGQFIKSNWTETDAAVTCKKCRARSDEVCPECGADVVRACGCGWREEA